MSKPVNQPPEKGLNSISTANRIGLAIIADYQPPGSGAVSDSAELVEIPRELPLPGDLRLGGLLQSGVLPKRGRLGDTTLPARTDTLPPEFALKAWS
jgi:hypothetical protein